MRINILPIKTNLIFKKTFNSCSFTGIQKLQCDIFSKRTDKTTGSFKESITNTEVFQKAKNYVMRSILSDAPKESMVVIQNGKIISSCEGTFASVDFADDVCELINKKGQNFIIVHSHPKSKHQMTTPVSFGDYETLVSYQGIDSVYAINSNGEYSGLIKLPERMKEFSDSATVANKVEEYENKYWQEFLGILDDETKEEYLHLRKRMQNPSSIMECIETFKDFDAFIKRIQEENKGVIQFVHNFWQKYASELGLKYETNYSFVN